MRGLFIDKLYKWEGQKLSDQLLIDALDSFSFLPLIVTKAMITPITDKIMIAARTEPRIIHFLLHPDLSVTNRTLRVDREDVEVVRALIVSQLFFGCLTEIGTPLRAKEQLSACEI